jgi:NAD(P)-dependent dehydrogenase (short-subunit alcohol dehydrogenase family)
MATATTTPLPGIKLFDLTGRTALITGGSKGLGYAMAAGLASAGADVMLVSRHLDEAQAAAANIARDFGRTAIGRASDVTSPEQVDAMLADAERALGKVDILINSAGINIRGPIAELTPEQFAQVMNVNVTGTWLACRAVLPGMRARKWGRIINLASALGLVGLAQRTPYTASKGAVVQMTRSLALETAAHGITVNAVCPGGTLTPYTIGRAAQRGLSESDLRAGSKADTLLGRWAEPMEVAWPVLWLASDEASFMTGTSLMVDGGTAAM